MGGLQPKWTFQSSGTSYSSPALGFAGTVFVSNDDGMLIAVDPGPTGLSEKWRIPLSNEIVSRSPVIGPDGTIFFGTRTGSLYSVNPETGEAQSIKIADEIGQLAIDADGTMYARMTIQKVPYLVAFTYAKGWHPDWKKWELPTKDTVVGIALDAEGTIYIAAETLYAINPDGSVKWKADSMGRPAGTPAIARDGTLYIKDTDGILYAFGH